ncbi:hypothetical protein [Myroides sp. DF42-4-2]|uniref:hypothetical protein n=1 Tax=Myroides sp. DF42-4-2 TaxID=2746726 RepID=UPI002574B348|nr:hypothetical protein [Myroides sp. DF42-4-2]MDM1408199.1 hypothetical protein [Myroides sp. DF42-4-2]
MGTKIKDILKKSGKNGEVFYKNKEKRTSFDETFSKNKMEIASKFIGSSSVLLAEKLNIK